MRVVDYGCGSLRVGAHFIRDHDPECYFGLDVTNDFYEYGKELIGEELLRQKRPRIATICPESLEAAAAFAPDILVSTACAFHVHPDEKGVYIENIKRIAHRPGARIVFDTKLMPHLQRYNDAAWARPLDFYTEAMAPMTLEPVSRITPLERHGYMMEMAWLVFRR
jgi:hypothetical protein